MPTLYVIRHGQPDTCGVLAGQSNPGLGTEGRRQSARIKIPNCTVYSSPLRRAFETALFLHPSPIVVDGLAEITYGEWDGLCWEEIERRWPIEAREKLLDWQRLAPPGGELWAQFAGRVETALKTILNRSETAAVVAHEAVNAIIAHHFTNSSVNKYNQGYCEVKTYHF